MNIVLVDLAGPDYPGGCEKYFANLAKYFSSNNNVIFTQSKQFSLLMEYFYHFLLGHKVGSIVFLKRDLGKTQNLNLTFSSVIPFSKKNKEVKKIMENADVIYSKNEFQELFLLYLLLGKKNYAKKVIVGVHSSIFIPSLVKGLWKILHNLQYKSYLYKLFLKSSKKIHVPCSEYLNLISHEYKISLEKIVSIPNPIDWKTKFYKTRNKKFTILWAGRLAQQKGLDRLGEVVLALSKKDYFQDLEILIAGEGGKTEKLLVHGLDLKYNNVKYLGFINNIEDLYSKTDLVLITSYFEIFPYAVLEPQSFGIPVISSNVFGSGDIINQGVSGFIVEDCQGYILDIEKFYNLWKQKETYESLKSKIHKECNKRFNKKNVMKEIQNLFYA